MAAHDGELCSASGLPWPLAETGPLIVDLLTESSREPCLSNSALAAPPPPGVPGAELNEASGEWLVCAAHHQRSSLAKPHADIPFGSVMTFPFFSSASLSTYYIQLAGICSFSCMSFLFLFLHGMVDWLVVQH